MASKPKAGGTKKRPAKAPLPAKKAKTQRERFIAAARDVGVDETGEEFRKALERIVPPRQAKH
jgi:hypothetical protein